ncbi:glycosyl hydrolase 115 family protein [Gramella sp. AN32]|uniref:Glycosyl hydrolase 115 family protein n=1 Tax=Christiangramia antarctica TaxID=2058158 RepID=A0ABW5X4L4_9FLAO|nr:glycosyl hydrolase 115 family protein [Gramella sp. AN32]MCM4157253.1 hypothetical protein [Gramella sp. AN32]
MNKIFFILFLLFYLNNVQSQDILKTFQISSNNKASSILYDKTGSSLDSLTAYLLAEDIKKITGSHPKVITEKKDAKGDLIIIGNISSPVISEFIDLSKIPEKFKSQKESYLYKIIKNPSSNGKKTFIIAGTDPRGTAFGIFELSKNLGVSPWYWWADVPVEKKKEITIDVPDFYSEEPAVEYRGIFLNDEDWGLQPWAAKTFEPETGDIGPKTYAKIFELLLRLKANTIWPAMHPSTKAFFYYPGNAEMAEKYHIVVGSSHAEPMLRNNVDEWNKDSLGSFNYISNKENVNNYWEERVKETSNLDALYTVGMRGIHDSGMEGVESTEEAAEVLSNVIKNQRNLLKKYHQEYITEIPQAFTVYKEVLELYDSGMELPEDITIIWTDDNYGYIRRLSNAAERQRSGGGGVYYHASYWGRPHDYLWLSSTHPGLIREEMMKAFHTKSKKIWILNVGDIKPAEYNIQLFMDMAYNTSDFEDPSYVTEHMQDFYTSIFGKSSGKEIADLKLKYFNLAYERKPEFMGWSQTEPTTKINTTAYTPFSWGDEVNTRMDEYSKLAEKAQSIGSTIDSNLKDAYFELVEYPVKGAAFMNKKFLYRDLAIKYSGQNRLNSKKFSQFSSNSYDSIVALTEKYNTKILNGKWNGIIDMMPRRLPVYKNPEIDLNKNYNTPLASIAVENQKDGGIEIPSFYKNDTISHFFDIYLRSEKEANWSIKKPEWIETNKTAGTLVPSQASERIDIKVNWKKWNNAGNPEDSSIDLNLNNQKLSLTLKVVSYDLKPSEKNIFIEKNNVVSIYAENFTTKHDSEIFRWKKISGLGYSNSLMQAFPFVGEPIDTMQLACQAPYLEYEIHTENAVNSAKLVLNALPTHPLTNNHSVRIGIQWNDNPIQIIDFKTYGRSEEWKQNVLRNLARKELTVNVKKGKQTLKIYMIDQGVALDFIYLKTKSLSLPYSLLPETKL